ncbi:MAG: hypothetical protein WCQ99_08880 [Pseudomonadota bacterium]
MKAYEYVAEILSDGHLSLPESIKDQIKPAEKIRVMLFLEDDDTAWNRAVMAEFAKGYSEKDAIYDNL